MWFLRIRCVPNSFFKLKQYRFTHTNSHVKIVEVGPRDGLQNEATLVPTDVKVEFINRLSETGLRAIEVTSFVSPKWVPQMSDSLKVFTQINKHSNISYPVLVPNLKGLEAALCVNVKEIAIFASATEEFCFKNLNCTIQESLKRFKDVTSAARQKGIKVRGYVSCVAGCPYEGHVNPSKVARVSKALLDMGCYEISLGDTIGVGTTHVIENMLNHVLSIADATKFAIHCHDTYGQALVNICTALEKGITVVDSSVSGLGGCPYAKGATGNVATEDLVYMLHGLGVDTGVDLNHLMTVGNFISKAINKPTLSKVNKALYKTLT